MKPHGKINDDDWCAPDELPREWKELKWIMSNMRICREAGDAKGVGKWTKKLVVWRDAHPEEAFAIRKELTMTKKRI